MKGKKMPTGRRYSSSLLLCLPTGRSEKGSFSGGRNGQPAHQRLRRIVRFARIAARFAPGAATCRRDHLHRRTHLVTGQLREARQRNGQKYFVVTGVATGVGRQAKRRQRQIVCFICQLPSSQSGAPERKHHQRSRPRRSQQTVDSADSGAEAPRRKRHPHAQRSPGNPAVQS